MGITIDMWFEIASLALTIVGGIFVYFQWEKSAKTKRAEIIHQIIDKLRFDEDLIKATYILDYNPYWYNDSFHNGNNGMEYIIDKFFCYIDYICYLRSTRNISEKEFKIFNYEVNRICSRSKSAQAYLWNLYHFAERNETSCSFRYIIDYGIKNGLFPKDFTTNKKLYRKQLNF